MNLSGLIVHGSFAFGYKIFAIVFGSKFNNSVNSDDELLTCVQAGH